MKRITYLKLKLNVNLTNPLPKINVIELEKYFYSGM